MSAAAAAGVKSSARMVVGALIALALGLACTVMWAAVLVAPSASMPGMGGMGGETMAAMTTVSANTSAMVADTASDAVRAVTSTCTSACVDDVADVCTLGVSLAVVTVLALLLGARPDTFMGLLARPRVVLIDRRPRWLRSPWTVLSLSRLCVLRV